MFFVMIAFVSSGLFGQNADNKYPDPAKFSKLVDGKETTLILLKNGNGITAAVTNFGARLVSLKVPSEKGLTDVVLGFNSIEEYLKAVGRNYGATVGRFANRIAGGKFRLDGKTYELPVNNNGNNIHGGPNGFNEQVWNIEKSTDSSVMLSLFSKDGTNGFPGNLKVELVYLLTKNNELRIDYFAETDKKTVINLTNHSFFNLNGSGSILDHEVSINADRFTPVGETLIPTGELKPVRGTPFDFRKPVRIGPKIDTTNLQIKYANGFDHNFVLNGEGMKLAATAFSPKSGITMKTYTTEPGMQFFTGNGFNGRDKDRNGRPILFRDAFCFETQHFPDSPNQPNFPSTIIVPGKNFRSATVYKFTWK